VRARRTTPAFSPKIATASTKAERAKLIKSLPLDKPALNREYVDALQAAASSSFMRQSGR
jgi:hypothetical protein